jgi:hypothetical protein
MIINILLLSVGFCAKNPDTTSLLDRIKDHKRKIKTIKEGFEKKPQKEDSKFFTPQFHKNFGNNAQKFLIDTIERRFHGPEITGARLLYRFPDTEKKDKNNEAQNFNKINFHEYIDDQENLLLVISLENGNKVGAWTKGYFAPGQKNVDAILFNLSTKESYELKIPDTKATTYDNYFLIFGNTEIRIKNQQYGFFSNFGISGSCFNTQGKKEDFCGNVSGDDAGDDIEFYEIYQLQLDEKWPFISHANWVQNILEWHDREDVETRQEWIQRRNKYKKEHSEFCQKKINDYAETNATDLIKTIKEKNFNMNEGEMKTKIVDAIKKDVDEFKKIKDEFKKIKEEKDFLYFFSTIEKIEDKKQFSEESIDATNKTYWETSKNQLTDYNGNYLSGDPKSMTLEKYCQIREQIDPLIALGDEK